MSKFAKLFEVEKYGQIVVMLDADDEGDPCIKFIGRPPGLGLCTTSLIFEEEDHAQTVFNDLGEEQAIQAVASMWQFGTAEVSA